MLLSLYISDFRIGRGGELDLEEDEEEEEEEDL